MRRETRANLIFLVVLLALMGPGITIMVVRRIGRPGRLIEPPPTREALSYIDTTAGHAPQMPRVVPPQLGGYVAEVTNNVVGMQSGLTSLVGDGRFAPIMSDNLLLQEIAAGPHDGKFRVALIAWSGALLPLPNLYRITGTRDGAALSGTIESYETGNMPIEIRRELQSYGYILPPDGYLWMIVAFDGERPVDTLTMKYAERQRRADDTIALGVRAASTRPAEVSGAGE